MQFGFYKSCVAALTAATIAIGVPALAQSSASSYSMGTYNPVQAAIWRNSMNAAILRQAAKNKRKLSTASAHRRVAARRR